MNAVRKWGTGGEPSPPSHPSPSGHRCHSRDRPIRIPDPPQRFISSRVAAAHRQTGEARRLRAGTGARRTEDRRDRPGCAHDVGDERER